MCVGTRARRPTRRAAATAARHRCTCRELCSSARSSRSRCCCSCCSARPSWSGAAAARALAGSTSASTRTCCRRGPGPGRAGRVAGYSPPLLFSCCFYVLCTVSVLLRALNRTALSSPLSCCSSSSLLFLSFDFETNAAACTSCYC